MWMLIALTLEEVGENRQSILPRNQHGWCGAEERQATAAGGSPNAEGSRCEASDSRRMTERIVIRGMRSADDGVAARNRCGGLV